MGAVPKGEQRFVQSSENNRAPKEPPNPGKGTSSTTRKENLLIKSQKVEHLEFGNIFCQLLQIFNLN